MKEIVHQFSTFFFAGTDTTANQTGIALYLLAKYPVIQEKVRKEINTIIPSFDEMTHAQIQQLEYFNAFYKESFRMYPSAPQAFPRVSTKDQFLDDLPVPKGAFIQNFQMQYNEEKFPILCKDIDTFNPDRFLEQKVVQDPFSFLPFSAGPRNCMGQHLALIETKIIITFILKNYVVLLNEDVEVKFNHVFIYTPAQRNFIKLQAL